MVGAMCLAIGLLTLERSVVASGGSASGSDMTSAALRFLVFLVGAAGLPPRERLARPWAGAGGASSARVRLLVFAGMLEQKGRGTRSNNR